MKRIEYFIIVNIFFIITAILFSFISKHLAHDGLTLTFIVGEPLTLFYMYKIKKISKKV
jgi:hypothetical protein